MAAGTGAGGACGATGTCSLHGDAGLEQVGGTRRAAGHCASPEPQLIEWEPAREDFTSVLVRHMNAYR